MKIWYDENVEKKKIERNVHLRKLKENNRMRMILSAVPGTAGNVIFAVLNGVTGLMSSSAWFGSLAAYYILLSIMRLRIVWQERRFVKLDQQERMKNEIRIYRKNSVLFLFMTIVLAGMVILLVDAQGGKQYPGFTIYAAALYMFYKMGAAIAHLIKERNRKSPVLMILYTSADSVLQICGHEKYTGLDVLYDCCKKAREITMRPDWKVARVIARPYVGEKKGEFKRTANRHDYAVKPFKNTMLNLMKNRGYDVISIGKIVDIFAEEGITESHRSQSSVHGMEQTIELADTSFHGLCFTNLVDFDALWGHRRDPEGYAKELEMFDENLGILLERLREDDLLMITADHGNDPTYTGTDHTREMVPLLCYSPSMKNKRELPVQDTFGVIGATIGENYDIQPEHHCFL